MASTRVIRNFLKWPVRLHDEGLSASCRDLESPKLAFTTLQPELMLHIVNHEGGAQDEVARVEALFLLNFSRKFASLTGQEFFDTYMLEL